MRRTTLRLLLLSTLTGPVQAHDPGLSTAEVNLKTSAVAVRLVLPRSQLAALQTRAASITVDSGSASLPSMELAAFVAGTVVLRDPLHPLAARRVEILEPSSEEILLRLEYPRPPDTLRLEFPLLSKFTRGHRLLVSIRRSTKGGPVRRLLDASAYGLPLTDDIGTGAWSWFSGLWVAAVRSVAAWIE